MEPKDRARSARARITRDVSGLESPRVLPAVRPRRCRSPGLLRDGVGERAAVLAHRAALPPRGRGGREGTECPDGRGRVAARQRHGDRRSLREGATDARPATHPAGVSARRSRQLMSMFVSAEQHPELTQRAAETFGPPASFIERLNSRRSARSRSSEAGRSVAAVASLPGDVLRDVAERRGQRCRYVDDEGPGGVGERLDRVAQVAGAVDAYAVATD